jgi:chemotaxis protein MotB
MKDFFWNPSMSKKPVEQLPLKKIAQKPLRFHNKQPQTENGNDIWLFTLSDLLMLLMVFFVVLFGMTFQRQKQVQQQPLPEKITVPLGLKENTNEAQTATLPNLIPKEIPASLEIDLTETLAQGQQIQREVMVSRNADRLVLTFPERIVFDPSQALLKPSAQPILDKIASFILEHSYLIVEVQGHTDDRPINTMRYPSNWELSVDRATQVAKALIRLGVDPSHLAVKGFGEYRSLCPNDSESNRLKNRRVEIQFSLPPQS